MSSKNPFVADELFFMNSSQPNFYKHSILYLIRVINSISIFVTGIPLSLLLFYLICKKSPEHLRAYSKMLLLGTIVDTYLLIQTFMLQMRLRSSSGITMVTFMGPLASFLGYDAFCVFLFFQSIGPQIGVLILPIQYYYRYYTITRNQSPTVQQTIIYFLIGSSSSLITGYNGLVWFCPNKPLPKIDVGPLWFDEVPIPPLLVRVVVSGNAESNINYLTDFVGPILLIVYYLIALWFGYLTMQELKRKFSSFTLNKNVQSMQAQLNRTLFFQSLSPLCAVIIPRITFLAASYMDFSTKYGGEIINLSVAWYPVLNMFSTIAFIVPYRRFCLRFFPCSKYYKCRSNVTIVNINSSRFSVPNQPNPTTTPATLNNYNNFF